MNMAKAALKLETRARDPHRRSWNAHSQERDIYIFLRTRVSIAYTSHFWSHNDLGTVWAVASEG